MESNGRHFVEIFDSFVALNYLFIVSRFFETGSLLDILKNAKSVSKEAGLTEDLVKIILREVLLAVKRLHEKKLIVKWLKPSNIFITLEGEVQLQHFSYGSTYSESIYKNTTYLSGTPVYLAPEVIENLDYSNKSDVWALGIIAMELFQGANPFAEPTSPVTLFDIVHKPPPKLAKPCTPEFRFFVESSLKKSPAKRMSVDELLDTPFIRSCPERQTLSNFVYSLSEMGRCPSTSLDSKSATPLPKQKGSDLNSKICLSKSLQLPALCQSDDIELDKVLESGQRKLIRKITLLNKINAELVERLFQDVLSEYTRELKVAGLTH